MGVGGATEGQSEGNISNRTKDGDGLDGGFGHMSHVPVGIAVVILANEDFALWMLCSQGYNEVDEMHSRHHPYIISM
jgi:hypothetical protein